MEHKTASLDMGSLMRRKVEKMAAEVYGLVVGGLKAIPMMYAFLMAVTGFMPAVFVSFWVASFVGVGVVSEAIIFVGCMVVMCIPVIRSGVFGDIFGL